MKKWRNRLYEYRDIETDWSTARELYWTVNVAQLGLSRMYLHFR